MCTVKNYNKIVYKIIRMSTVKNYCQKMYTYIYVIFNMKKITIKTAVLNS